MLRCLVLAALTLLTGCDPTGLDKTPQSTPGEAAIAFEAAVVAGDVDAVLGFTVGGTETDRRGVLVRARSHRLTVEAKAVIEDRFGPDRWHLFARVPGIPSSGPDIFFFGVFLQNHEDGAEPRLEALRSGELVIDEEGDTAILYDPRRGKDLAHEFLRRTASGWLVDLDRQNPDEFPLPQRTRIVELLEGELEAVEKFIELARQPETTLDALIDYRNRDLVEARHTVNEYFQGLMMR